MKHAFVLLSACSAPLAIDVVAPTPGKPTRRVDFDGDGLADLAFPASDLPAEVCRGMGCWTPNDAPASQSVAVFLGRDQGQRSQLVAFETRPYSDLSDAARPVLDRIASVGDLDGDGHTDLAMLWERGGDEEMWLVRGTASGIDAAPYQTIQLPRGPDRHWYNLDPLPAGDVDGDGHPDVVIGSALLRGIGGGKLAAPELVKASRGDANLLPIGDVDGDGAADLVAVNTMWDGEPAKTWLVRGGNTLAAPVELAPAPIIGAVDVDGDGVRELIGVGSNTRVTTYAWVQGQPSAVATVDMPLRREPPAWWELPSETSLDLRHIYQAIGVGDDLVVVMSASLREVICNTQCWGPTDFALQFLRGDKLVGTRIETPDEQPRVASPGDFDGDHVPDLVVQLGGELVVHRSRGGELRIAGTSTQSRRVTLAFSAASLVP